MDTQSRDPGGTRLLAFLGPGLVHGLGNALFAVQGHIQILGVRGQDIQRDKQTIMASSQRAMDLLELFRSLVGAGQVQDTPMLAGPLMQRLQDLMRVALREWGLGLQVDHSSRETPVQVAPSVFGRVVSRAAQTLAERVPPTVAGAITMDLFSQQPKGVQVRVGVRPESGTLPFPVDAASAVEDLQPDLTRARGRVEAVPARNAVDIWIPSAERGVPAVLAPESDES